MRCIRGPFLYTLMTVYRATQRHATRSVFCYFTRAETISVNGETSLVLGVAPMSDDEKIKLVIEGLLPGIKLEKYEDGFEDNKDNENSDHAERYLGCITGVPSLKIDGKYQYKDISSLMRSLNGQNYIIMVICRPIDEFEIQNKIDEAIKVQDSCFAISKRTVGYQRGESNGNTHSDTFNNTESVQKGKNSGVNVNGGLAGAATGAAAGAAVGSIVPGVGTALGAIGGGLIGLIAGKQVSFSKGKSSSYSSGITKGYSDAVTQTISNNISISGEVQNGFALELMKMSESLIERLKTGRSRGMWDMSVSYSSDSKLAAEIIKGSLYSEIASNRPDVLPPVVFDYVDKNSDPEYLMIPKDFFVSNSQSSLCTAVTSEELCGLCTIPTENTVGFSINTEKPFSLHTVSNRDDQVIGNIAEYDRVLPNIQFGLNKADINKHVFVCGMTGYGKTNTVKKILEAFPDVPYLVIEPAKKEYRNMSDSPKVYTFGRPEINCVRMNPFYIMPGVNPQQHIDLLKDLFSASFAFYGPMPYIFEKCLNRIYLKKGWNLSLGFHPLLVNENVRSNEGLFDDEAIEKKYRINSHRYLFPTMQDLKDEIKSYIDNELEYEGDVKGNIKSAIESRIDSLCIGSKGYMFNTNDITDFDQLVGQKAVIELEGLSDDADKAFALGMLIIFINEFRQIEKEVSGGEGLKHILVIEEAHRLLKNVSATQNEDIGNPKGKSVEHFANLLAEMRSYGQGVIVAEQIPCKLTPDVIKNSSVKIVHRIVAKDDQEIIANTIGITEDEMLSLGNRSVGYALCHKDGMVEPVNVKINQVKSRNVTDAALYTTNLEEKLEDITGSILKGALPEYLDMWAVKLLVSMMYRPEHDYIWNGMNSAVIDLWHRVKVNAVALIPNVDVAACIKICLSEKIISLMTTGVYSSSSLPNDDLTKALQKIFTNCTDQTLADFERQLERFYFKKPKKRAVEIVAGLISEEYAKGQDISAMAEDFLAKNDPFFGADVISFLERRK